MQQQFLHDEVLRLTVDATLQHSRTYGPRISQLQKAEFHKTLREALEATARNYSGQVDDEGQIRSICGLADPGEADPELEVLEGELRYCFVGHRSRERALRDAKIREAMALAR